MLLTAGNFQLSDLLPANGGDGSQGVTLFGIDAKDRSGAAVHGIGDINRDGYEDVIIGTQNTDGLENGTYQAGESYVVFGRADWTTAATLDLSALDGTNGFSLFGIDSADYAGRAVSGGGDVNGDGIPDLVIGAQYADSDGGSNSGEAYVIFGKTDWSNDATFRLSELDGSNGFTLTGSDPRDEAGATVEVVGDVNADGFDDILIGAPGADGWINDTRNSGECYLVFGGSDWTSTPRFSLRELDGHNGIRLTGVDPFDVSGSSISGAGDVNGDGYDDFLIGAYNADGPGNSSPVAGDTYLVFGRQDWSGVSTRLLENLDGTTGVTFHGANSGDGSGWVGRAGDVNGDGLDDILIGAFLAAGDGNATSGSGEASVVFGRTDWSTSSTMSLANLTGLNGFVVFGSGVGDHSGKAVDGAGDVNGDGYADLLIAAFEADEENYADSDTGETYVIYGKSDWSQSSTVDTSGLNGVHGFTILGADRRDLSGFDVRAAGDVNGDGFSDILIGSRDANGNGDLLSDAGETYIVFGGDFTAAVTHPGTASGDFPTGTSQAEVLVGGRGDDIIEGAGGFDVIRGGQGDDVIIVPDLSFLSLDGGTGEDVLQFGGNISSIDLTQIPHNRLSQIEQIDLRGNGSQALQLNKLSVLRISDESHRLIVHADADDTLVIGDNWSRLADQIIDGEVFAVLSQQAVELRIPATHCPPVVTLSASSKSLREAGGQVHVIATLSYPALVQVAVPLSFAGSALHGIDYAADEVTIVINPGATTGAVTLMGIADQETEPHETIEIEVVQVAGAVEDSQQLVTVTITPLLPPVITGPSARTRALRPVFEWDGDNDATSSELWIRNQSTGVNPALLVSSPGTSFQPAQDLGIGRYNLWMRSHGAEGQTSLYTSQYNFQIATSVTLLPLDRQLATATPQIGWEALPGAVHYDLWIDNTSTGQSEFIRDSAVDGTTWLPSSDLPLGSYIAWVRGIAADGSPADWSQPAPFRIMPPPKLTGGINPTFDRTPTFSWESLHGAAEYEVFIRDRNNGQTVYYERQIITQSFTVPAPLADGPYRVWVIGVSEQNVRSFWTDPVDIYVGGRTDLLSPTGTTDESTPQFTWRPVDGAQRYELWVDVVGGPNRVIDEQNLTVPEFTPIDPLSLGTYRVWVRAISTDSETSPWSVTSNFRIASLLFDPERLNQLDGLPEDTGIAVAERTKRSRPADSDCAEPRIAPDTQRTDPDLVADPVHTVSIDRVFSDDQLAELCV